MNLLITLQHTVHREHNEHWYQKDNGGVFVESNTHGKRETIHLTPFEAMRNYMLMVSKQEGWKVLRDYGWRDWVDKQNAYDPFLNTKFETADFSFDAQDMTWTMMTNRNAHCINLSKVLIHHGDGYVHLTGISKAGRGLTGGIWIDNKTWKNILQAYVIGSTVERH